MQVPHHHTPALRKRHRGLTLLELMIAVTIVGILAAIAVPGYQHSVRRAQRIDARLALLRVQFLQERHYSSHARYATNLTTTDNDGLGTADLSDAGGYRLSLATDDTGQRYTAIATANGAQMGDQHCQRLAIDHTGARRAASTNGPLDSVDTNRCWG
jgi:type IV pilus assembly protein PilE